MNLSDPLTDPIALFTSEFRGAVVLAPDIQGIEPALFDTGGVLNGLSELSFDVSTIMINHEVAESGPVSIQDALDNYPTSTKYLFGKGGATVLYDCPRDTLSILFLDWSLSQDELSELDRNFIEHVRDVGIGFGKEGEGYLSTLLEKLFEEQFIEGERRAALEMLA